MYTIAKKHSLSVLINVYSHAVTANYKSMQVFNSATNNIKNIALIQL